MRLAATLLIAGLGLPAAALDLATLAGNWVVDAEAVSAAMEASPEFAAMPVEQRTMMKNMMTPMLAKISCSLGAEGLTLTDPMGKKQTMPATSFTSTGDTTGTIADEMGAKTLITLRENGSLAIAPEENPGGMQLILTRGTVAAAATGSATK